MSEFDHWYTKADYESLELKKDAEIHNLKAKITKIRDLIDGVDTVRDYNSLPSLSLQQQLGSYGGLADYYRKQQPAPRMSFLGLFG